MILCDGVASFAFFLFANRFYDCDFVGFFRIVYVCAFAVVVDKQLSHYSKTDEMLSHRTPEKAEKNVEIVAKTKVFFLLIGVINRVLEGIFK